MDAEPTRPKPPMPTAVGRRLAALAIAGVLALGLARPIAAADTELGASAIGNYLAGRHAQARRDLSAAADFLEAALKEAPDAPDLLRRTFILMVVEGRFDDAMKLARRLIEANPKSAVANLALATDDLKRGRYRKVLDRLRDLPDSGLGAFTNPTFRAWSEVGRKKYEAALAALEPLGTDTGSQSLNDLHAAMINEVAGRRQAAIGHYEALATANSNATLRLTQLLGGLYERVGEPEKARALYETYLETQPDSRLFEDALQRMKKGRAPKSRIRTAQDGAAEALFSIASSLRQQHARETALVLGQLALYLKPEFPIMLILIGDIMESEDRLAEANAFYASISKRSAFSWTARLRIASNLDAMDDTDKAVRLLKTMAKEDTRNPQPLIKLGDIMRSHERYREAIEAYDDALERIGTVESRHWSLLYTRGIVLERAKEWQRAEADLLKALELEPDQPYVLNYLGYSWVDQGQNLERAQDMIRTAVKLRPNDGYIIDSLGWVYYRLGDYAAAVKQLERAVELRPEDPVINDHLGDAYWRVGRRLEATFQWKHSLSLDPEDDLGAEIEAKLKDGLGAAEGVPAGQPRSEPAGQPENAAAAPDGG